MSQDLSPKARAERIEAALEWGRKLCRENDVQPTLGLIIWELMMEAAETLRAMPDRERGWLYSAGRSSMPDFLRDVGTDYADFEAEARPAVPRADQVSRMEEVLSWFEFFRGKGRRRRDLQVVFSLASGLPRYQIAQKARTSEGNLYKIRDRQIRAVSFELNRLRSLK